MCAGEAEMGQGRCINVKVFAEVWNIKLIYVRFIALSISKVLGYTIDITISIGQKGQILAITT